MLWHFHHFLCTTILQYHIDHILTSARPGEYSGSGKYTPMCVSMHTNINKIPHADVQKDLDKSLAAEFILHIGVSFKTNLYYSYQYVSCEEKSTGLIPYPPLFPTSLLLSVFSELLFVAVFLCPILFSALSDFFFQMPSSRGGVRPRD